MARLSFGSDSIVRRRLGLGLSYRRRAMQNHPCRCGNIHPREQEDEAEFVTPWMEQQNNSRNESRHPSEDEHFFSGRFVDDGIDCLLGLGPQVVM